ncbi:MAG: efflux RND transporter periplasmic adaptor subunit [Alistipes sp.]|nr:efflux RND transporter periplasmic adaptor subunit [Alistipes sp.]
MKTIFKSLLIAAVAMAGVSCKEKKAVQEQTETIPSVAVETVSSRDVIQQTVFTGTVEADVVNNIAPQQPRRISRILVDVGDRVKAGQLLVELDRSSLVQAKAQMDNALIEYERTNELYEFGGASKSEWDARRLQYDVAKSTYDNLLENTTLVSPVAGIVSARNYDNGDMAGSSPILVVEQIRPVKIMINVSESLFPKVRRGMKIYVTFDAYGDEQFTGKVTRIYPTVDNSTRTFQVEVSLPNSDERIRPGMFARVTLPYDVAKHVVIPDRAILKLMGSGDRYVYIYNPTDGTVRYSKVELGRRMDAEYEVLSGVENGDKVDVIGQNALSNGAKVELK